MARIVRSVSVASDTVLSIASVIRPMIAVVVTISISVYPARPADRTRRRSAVDIDLLLVVGEVEALRLPEAVDADQVAALRIGGRRRVPRPRLRPGGGVGPRARGIGQDAEQRERA